MLLKNKKPIFRILKLLRASFNDPLFWLLLADYILTLFVINSGAGHEANPFVVRFGNGWAFVIELFLYFVCMPKKNWGFVRILFVAFYSFLIARHIIILIG